MKIFSSIILFYLTILFTKDFNAFENRHDVINNNAIEVQQNLRIEPLENNIPYHSEKTHEINILHYFQKFLISNFKILVFEDLNKIFSVKSEFLFCFRPDDIHLINRILRI